MSAVVPRAVFPAPAVLSKRAAVPTAVLEVELLRTKVPAPTAVLKLPSEVPNSAYQPTPVFPAPLVRFWSALHPSAVVKPG